MRANIAKSVYIHKKIIRLECGSHVYNQRMEPYRPNNLALLLILVAILASYFVTLNVFERIPHLEDEIAYVWQANVIAEGRLTVDSPPRAEDFKVPFVVDYKGYRFGKYPPGWPAMLALGVRLGLREWVNPLLAGLAAWLMYRLARKLLSETAALFAVFLLVTSPLFLIQSGSLMSHTWSLVLAAGFMLAWLDLFTPQTTEPPTPKNWLARPAPDWMLVLVAGLTLGSMALTRPLSAIGVALPFGVHGIILLIKGNPSTRLKVLGVGGLALLVALLIFAWQYAVTGDPFLNPYTLWWSKDKIGFGPDFGYDPGGHTLQNGLNKTYGVLYKTGDEFNGWGQFWWVFMPFGVWALRRKTAAWLTGLVFPSLLLVYLSYWVISFVLGPRYYFEGLISLIILNTAGLAWALETTAKYKNQLFAVARTIILAGTAVFVFSNLFLFLPRHFDKLTGLYNIHSAQLTPFLTPEVQALAPAVVVVTVKEKWNEYTGLLELQDARLTSPFIFTRTTDPNKITLIARAYPERQILYYYFDDPYRIHFHPRP